MRNRWLRDVLYCLLAPLNWIGHNIHNSYGIAHVFDLTWLRPVGGGLIPNDHPYATGIDPKDGESLWYKNMIYQSPRKKEFKQTDEEIVEKVMSFLSRMVSASASTELHPKGKKDRMPPAVNYIHGTVHANGVSLVFDDFKDALAHFTCPNFLKDFNKMIHTEKREPTIIFRDRNYDPEEKSKFPFFGNPNGNKKRLHWGTPAPYPVFNLITGYWIHATQALRTEEGRRTCVRPAIEKNLYLQGANYGTGRNEYLWPEKFWASFTDNRIKARGDRGGVYFTDKRKLDNGFRYDPENLITLKERMNEKMFGDPVVLYGTKTS
jgi:hypothetical protein